MEHREYYEPLSSMIADFIESADHRFEVRMHYHDGYEILFFEQARALFRADITICDIADGDVLFIRPYTMHTAYRFLEGPYRRYYVNVASGILEQFARRMGMAEVVEALSERPFTLFHAGREPALLRRAHERFESIWQLAAGKRGRWQERTQAELVLLLSDLADSAVRDSSYREPVRENLHFSRMLAYIDQHLREGVALRDLEEEFFLSRHYICRLFRQHTGLTVSQYVNRKKVILAQQLLIDPSATVTDACYGSGFAHIQYFSKVFKKITGMTPSAYRKVAASGERSFWTGEGADDREADAPPETNNQ
ncbi:MAG: AraC family transcriptional regulator [Christensenellales bacterium]